MTRPIAPALRGLAALVAGALLLGLGACSKAPEAAKFTVADSSFKCMKEMTKVRHFFVDNLAGQLQATVDVATSGKGEYPYGTVLQIMPNEVMIKQAKGSSPATKDWEFLWIDNDKSGSKIFVRGTAEVSNRFGLNCFACHVKAKPEFDLVCEADHGCDPLPVTRAMFSALQNTDPRCKGSETVSAEDQESLKQLDVVVKALTKKEKT